MITLRTVSKSFGSKTLFEKISLQVNEGDRFALVGPNGAGKSTLFKLIMGTELPDEGRIVLRAGVRFGYLPQETALLSGGTVLEEALGEFAADPKTESRAKKILMGLGFRVGDFFRPSAELSGGWQMRAMIARLLMGAPDVLLLDEPTNHLDLESLLWFQSRLQGYRGAVFLISHDRAFIDAVTDRIIELKNPHIQITPGPFQNFLDQKKQEEERLLSAYKRQQKEIEQLEVFINRFRAKASLAASVQSKIKYLEKMEKIELPPDIKTVGFQFPQPQRSGQNVLELKNIRQSYDGKNWVYDGLNLTLERGQKVALVGPNGAGKSTLLKLLAGVLPFQEGERKVGHQVQVGYFSQHRDQMFKLGRTVFDEAKDTPRGHSETTIRTVLGSFLFTGDAVEKKIDVLSGGEKSRLGLVKILLNPPNLVLMDEPTTHLDIASVEVLMDALKAFAGVFCFISHDVFFIRQLANHIIHVDQGKITWYPGPYDYFLHKKAKEEGEEAELFRSEEIAEAVHGKPTLPKPSAGGGKKSKEQKRREAEERNLRYRLAQADQTQSVQKRALEAERQGIWQALSDRETHDDPQRIKELNARLGEIQKQLGKKS